MVVIHMNGVHTIDMGAKLGIVGDSYMLKDLHFLHFMIESLDNHQRSKTFQTPIKIIIQVSFSA